MSYLQRRGGAPPTTHPAVSSLLARLRSPPSRAFPYASRRRCWVTLGSRVDGRLEKRDRPLLPEFARLSRAARAATSRCGYTWPSGPERGRFGRTKTQYTSERHCKTICSPMQETGSVSASPHKFFSFELPLHRTKAREGLGRRHTSAVA